MYGFLVSQIPACLKISLGQGAAFRATFTRPHTRMRRAPEPLLNVEIHLGGHPVF